MLQKIKYSKIDKFLYQDKLDNKLGLIIAPLANVSTCKIGLNLSVGYYGRYYYFDKVKMGPGIIRIICSCLIKKHSEKANNLFNKDVDFKINYFESYTSFEVSCENKQAGNYLTSLLHLFDSLDITNDELEEVKKEIISKLDEEKTPSDLIRSNLYINSPMSFDSKGSKEEINKIHLPQVRKFFNYFFKPDYLTLFVVGNLNPEDVYNFANKMVFASKDKVEEPVIKSFKENYEKVESSLGYTSKENHLILGMKFYPRKVIFEKFSKDMFSYYFLLTHIVFSKFNNNLKNVFDSSFSLENVSLNQGGEDAFLTLDFKTGYSEKLEEELKSFISKGGEMITKKDFKFGQKVIFKQYKQLYSTDLNLYYNDLLDAFANEFAAPNLVEQASKIKYKHFANFLDFISKKFPTSILISKK